MAESAPQGGFAQFAAEERAANERAQAEQAQAAGLQTEQQEFTVNAQLLDNAAEMRVYGSRGHTYYENPDGSGDVVADADHVLPSRADQIRGDESFDPNPQTRRRMADGYMRDVDDLTTNKGLNLFQAERIAEGRLADRRNIFRMTGRFMDGEEVGGRYDDNNGTRKPENAEMDYDEAHQRALNVYLRKDENRVRQARLENPYTRADEQARIDAEAAQRRGNRDEMMQEAAQRRADKEQGKKIGEKIGDLRKEEQERPDPAAEAKRAAEDAEIQRLQEVLTTARNDYARRVAGSSRRAIHTNRDFRRRGVEAARVDYENARDQLGGVVAHLYREAGATDDMLDVMAWSGAAGESVALTKEIREEKLIATGDSRYRREQNPDGTARAVEVPHGRAYRALHAPANALYNFYARNSVPASGGRRIAQIAKKTVVIGAIGTGAGLAAGLVAGAALPVGAGVAGALIANRVTKAYMASRIRRGSNNRLVDAKSNQLQNTMVDYLNDPQGNSTPQTNARRMNTAKLTNFSEEQRQREIKWNRIRLGTMAVGLAVGGYVLEHAVMGGETTGDFFGGNTHEHSAEPSGGNNHSTSGGSTEPYRHPPVNYPSQSPEPITASPSELPNVNLNGAEYPWNWAANKFGEENATPELLKLVHQAQAAGVDIRTHELPGGRFDISIGDDYNTEDVVRVLNETNDLAN